LLFPAGLNFSNFFLNLASSLPPKQNIVCADAYGYRFYFSFFHVVICFVGHVLLNGAEAR